MQKPRTSGNKVRVERWTLGQNTAKPTEVRKVAVRNSLGQFHGATNFKGSILSK